MTDQVTVKAAAQDAPVYEFMAYDRGGCYALMLVDQHIVAAAHAGQRTEAWFSWITDRRERLQAMARWVRQRGEHWQEWGAMTRSDPDAFRAHFAALVAAEPVAPLGWGYTLERDPADARRVVLWELHGARGPQRRTVAWERRYCSAGAATRAFRWLHADDNVTAWQALASLADMQGPDLVSEVVDRAVAARRWG